MRISPPSTTRAPLLRAALLVFLIAGFALVRQSNAQTPADGIGGGWLHGGAVGEYFANADLTGAPSFSRRDVRVDFDWGTLRGPGGSNSPALAAVGADGFSVRWSGQIEARFAETYTFTVACDDGARLFIKPTGGNSWTAVIDQWSAAGTHTGAFALLAEQSYDVVLEYREVTGAASCRLRWSSPSTPEEMLDAATLAALNMYSYEYQYWANAMDQARNEWGPVDYVGAAFPGRDASGWPVADSTSIVWEGQTGTERRGMHLLQFRGRAAVRCPQTNVQFTVGATNHGQTLPFEAGYDAGTNTTTAFLEVVDGTALLYLTFTNTRRLPTDAVATGVTEVKLMRPVTPGSATPSALGTIVHPPMEDALQRYAALRWILNFDTEITWSQRRLPSFSTRRGASFSPSWEHMVMMSNETGKDLYLCLPVRADDDYITRVAQLLRYGSDGVNPYASEQAAPLYPPLNPNLRAYVERENEVWNFSYTNYANNVADVTAAAQANTADWQVVNFDGAFTGNPLGARQRWHALRTLRASQFFRGVFGDAAMGPRIRPLYEYQYDNLNNTARDGLTFLDAYFNNADGIAHVPIPHPVSYHLWGGGGAVYYSSGNSQGVQSGAVFANGGLETPIAPEGTVQQQPAGAAWNFTGTAGIYTRAAAGDGVTIDALGSTATAPAARAQGFRFTTGAQPVAVYELGRWVAPSTNAGSHEIRILRASDRATMAVATVSLAGATPGQYRYAPRFVLPSILAANTSYYLVSTEAAGGDPFYENATVTAAAGITVNSRVTAAFGNPTTNPTLWTFTEVEAGARTFGPVNMRCTATPMGALAFPPDPIQGTQAAYLAGTGQMEQTINFPAAGVYAMRFLAAAKVDAESSVRFFVDGTNITPTAASHAAPSPRQWSPGPSFNLNYRVYTNYSTYVFEVAAPGAHTLRIEGLGIPRFGALNQPPDPNRVVYFDNLEIVSADAFFAGGVPGIGEANGQAASTNSYTTLLFSEQRYAQAYGLHPVAYEGGWSAGGDFAATAFQNWCKFHDPRARQAQLDSLDVFALSGSRLYTFGTYDTWPADETANSAAWPLAQGVDDHNAALPPLAINGIHVPAALTPANRRWSLLTSPVNSAVPTGIASTGGFFAWNALVPETGTYALQINTQSGGTAVLEVDGAPFGAAFTTGGALNSGVTLSAGLHTLRLRSASGGFTVDSIVLSQAGTPDAPTLTSAVEENSRVMLAWSPPASGPAVDGYLIRYGTAPTRYDGEVTLGNVTGATLTGLTNGVTFYFSIVATNAAGYSLLSNERAATPAGPGQPLRLGAWEFTGLSGNLGVDVSSAPYFASGFATVGALTRGPGLRVGYNQLSANTFASGGDPADNSRYGQNLAESMTRGQFYTFTIAPAAGRTLALSRFEFRPYYQSTLTVFGTAVAWSTDGSNFTTAPPVSGTQVPGIGNGALFTADLSGIAALQGTTATVTLRIHVFGIGQFAASGLGGVGDDLAIFGSYGNVPTALDTWRALHGLAADGSQDLQTPAGDGVPNLLKFALNLAPSSGDLLRPAAQPLSDPDATTPAALIGLPSARRDAAGQLQITFLRRRAAAALGLNYTVEFSDDLATDSWIANPSATAAVLTIDATWERVTVTDSPLIRPARFVQLRIGLP